MSILNAVFFFMAGVLYLEKVWRHVQVVRFFANAPAKPSTFPEQTPVRISIVQPILSGDPTMPTCLEESLCVSVAFPVEVLWMVDQDDVEGQRVCRDLIARFPERSIRMILTPPAPSRHSPKLAKLIAGFREAEGNVFCVLDDDTVLAQDSIERCISALDRPGVGLAFGLPYYVSFTNFWSSLVAAFVNSHSLLTYVPYTYLVPPFTINGMFYVIRKETYERIGGFEEILPILADDFAVARHVRQHGYRLAQTTVRHALRNHVHGPGYYFRLVHRWLIFPRETLMRSLDGWDRVVAFGMGLAPCFGPLVLLAGIACFPGLETVSLFLGYLAYHFAIFAHFNLAYLQHATPWRWCWLVPVVQLALPIQLVIALVMPQRILWRGHRMRIEPGGTFEMVRRRQTPPAG